MNPLKLSICFLFLAIIFQTSCNLLPQKGHSSLTEKTTPNSSIESIATSSNSQSSSSTQTAVTPAQAQDLSKDILFYFHKVYPHGSKKPVESINLEETYIKNGYLKVTGNVSGYYVFNLFKGKEADFLVEQSSQCTPDCSQKFKVFVFRDQKLDGTKSLEDFYPYKQVERHLNRSLKNLSQTTTGKKFDSWILLPKMGASIDIFILDQKPGGTSGNTTVYLVGKLNWNGFGFDFQKINASSKSNISIDDIR